MDLDDNTEGFSNILDVFRKKEEVKEVKEVKGSSKPKFMEESKESVKIPSSSENNYEKTINSLRDKIDSLQNSYDKLEKNHEIFKKDYKKKCEDYNKLLNKLEQKNIKKEFFSEYEILKQRNQQYFDKYGNI